MTAKKSPAKKVAARKVPIRVAATRKVAKRITPEKRAPLGAKAAREALAAAAKPKAVVPRLRIGISAAQRAEMRGRAHSLDAVVMIGADGLTPGVVTETDKALDAHELIKVRVHGDDRDERVRLFERLCAATGAEPVQHIGKLLVLYRRSYGKPEGAAAVDFGAPREVVVRKASRSANRAAKRTVVTVLANQRVTAGGTVKRQKPRQKSVKKLNQG
ncbi:hypothetical protein BH10PSE17_BH10PSE17_33620 [soil metagenome]